MSSIVIYGILIVLLSGFIQGLTAFGFALVALPLLSILMPVQQVVPIIIILSLVTNIGIWYETRKSINLKKYGLLIISSLLAAPIGTKLIVLLNPDTLKVIVGILITFFAIMMLTGTKWEIKHEKLSFILVGLLSGVLNGSISTSGPPVALFLSNQEADKQKFKANLNMFGLILNVVTIGLFFQNGLITSEILFYVSRMLPADVIGVVLGIIAIRKLNEKTFKNLTLYLVIFSGIWTLLSGLGVV